MRPRLVIISVDGGQPETVRRGGFFAPPALGPYEVDSGVSDLQTVYPSSTATAHASFITGSSPREHGIVGNRFWDDTTVAKIRTCAEDPLASFHPYEHSSLQTSSLLDWCSAAGLSTAAAHFPQTLSRSRTMSTAAYYCLYAPQRTLNVPAPLDDTAPVSAAVSYFGMEFTLNLHFHRAGATLHCTGVRLELPRGKVIRLSVDTPAGLLSVPVILSSHGGGATLTLLKASLVLHPNNLHPAVLTAEEGPSAATASYVDADGGQYFEAPTTSWVAQTAARILEHHDPDVLFLRFNQTDHVQEFLTWQRLKGSGSEVREATEQVMQTYASVSEHVAQVVSLLGSGAQVMLFSDHGIDWVETHLRPNAMLDQLGLASRMVFQGDSTCAFLYTDESLSTAELAHVRTGARSLGPGVQLLDTAGTDRLGLPGASGRTGQLVLTCEQHTEFIYSGTPARQAVRSASHGFLPDRAAMSGFFRTFGPVLQDVEPPVHLTNVASLVQLACRQMFGSTHG